MIYTSIDAYSARLMQTALEVIPKETKAFLGREARKLKKDAETYADKNVPRSRIPASESHKKYHDHFEVGKGYKDDENTLKRRVYNNSGHGKYVEYGRTAAKGYKRGEAYSRGVKGGAKTRHYEVFQTVRNAFEPVFIADCGDFVDKMIEEQKL